MRFEKETHLPDTYYWPVPGHTDYQLEYKESGFFVAMICECGEKLYPNNDNSTISMQSCFNTHRLNVMNNAEFKSFLDWVEERRHAGIV